ncbi:MAG: 2-oxo acid dehydrogenase subunit E2 [Candidatus Thorarchaeota archaeon]|jgi:pyruvate/2-oxoglutarate dehydrogenase complex dihydrolipoamide acyltransferase (E2) component
MDDKIGPYEVKPFPKERTLVIDNMEMGSKTHHMKGLFELDVTDGRKVIHSFEERTGKDISFTSWIMKCIALAIKEHKHVHALRKGKKKIIIFDEIDISLPVEKKAKTDTLPLPLVIRKVDEKSVLEITSEIREAQAEETEGIEVMGSEKKSLTMRLVKYFPSFPKFLRNIIYRRFKDPFFLKENAGTVLVTTIGMFSRSGGFAIPLTPNPLVFAIGGISKKPGVVDDRIEVREYLSITVLIDHDTVDGGPATRFVSRFAELIETASGLEDLV